MTQLVVSGNRILAHGEDCFLAMGGTVICTVTGRKFENATVVFHDGAIPSDIDSVGYEYHAGEFVPCAPFGTGTGNIAVFCDDSCKALKDSGISAERLPNVIETGLTLSYLPYVHIGGCKKIIYASGMFVVLQHSSVMYSKDLEVWETAPLPFSYTLDIAYGGGKFVVVASDAFAYSTDGTTWTVTIQTDEYGDGFLSHVAYGNDRFVVVGYGQAGYSTDGENWSALSPLGIDSIRGMAFGNGMFVVQGSEGTAYSTDGITWTKAPEVNTQLVNMKFLNGAFVTITKYGNIYQARDPAGEWTTVATLYYDTQDDYTWYDIDFKDGVYVAVSNGSVAMNANDPVDKDGWLHTKLSASGMSAVTNNGEQFVAVGECMLTSKDGKEWPARGKYRIRTPDLVDVTDTVKSVLGL